MIIKKLSMNNICWWYIIKYIENIAILIDSNIERKKEKVLFNDKISAWLWAYGSWYCRNAPVLLAYYFIY